jgi:filamentous hemagglutinin
VNLSAGHDLTISTADTSTREHHYKEEEKSGSGAAGVGISWGTNQAKDTSNDTLAGSQGSLVGSTAGSVHMQAGNTLHVTGSDIVAAQDVTGIGAKVTIDPSKTDRHHDETHEEKSSGFALGVKSSVIDAVQSAAQQADAVGESGDGRVNALHAMAAVGSVANAVSPMASGGTPDAKVELSWGSSSSKSTFSEDSTNHTGSTVTAGGTAAFVATGNGTPGSGNVTIAGSDITAGNVVLSAANAVNLVNSTDTDSTRSTNESHSASVGVSYGTSGYGISASMSQAHGDANSDAALQNNTHVNAANGVTIVSGGDTNIIGAVVNGKQVTADVGGNLNIASVQDTSRSESHQSSSGGGFSISQGGGSASYSSQHGDASGNYAGVNEQSGIHAGEGGFDLTVKGSTALHGAYIASDADPSKNTLTTGTLTFDNVQNSSSYDASSSGFSVGGSYGGNASGKAAGVTSVSGSGGVAPMLSQHDSGNNSAATGSAISAGTINLTDGAHQTQDIASLNRDASNLNGTVAKTPDLTNLLNQQSDTMAAAIVGQSVAKGIGQYAESRAAAARAAGDEAEAAKWDEGGKYRTEMHIAGGALVAGMGTGSAGAVLGGAAGAGVSAYAARGLNGLSDAVVEADPTGDPDRNRALGNILANALATGAGAVVGGNAGAVTASNADLYNRSQHNGKPDKDLVSQVCGAGAKCSDATLNAAIQAQGANADAAAANLQTMGMYGAPAAALMLLGPQAVTAAVLAGGLDYAGSTYSYRTGLSKDEPSVTNSYIAGVVGGLSYPFAISGTAIAGMGTAGKIAANAYNAGVAGVGAYGTAGMTGNNPNGAAAAATIATAAGSGAQIIFPGKLGNLLNQMIQGAAGPVQNAVQNRPSDK